MRHLTLALVLALLGGGSLCAEPPVVRLVEFEAAITPISARRITQAIEDAEREGDALVLVRLDTPGGMVDSMESIVKKMLSAKVPIAVWVGPSGAKAASAGFFVLVAADVAAMAPGTRTGAASTVYGFGGENREGDVLLKKANQDLAALIRSIAERRGRNAEACEAAVFEATAYEEGVALERGLIDLVVGSQEALLAALDGREVHRFDGTAVVLRTTDATFATSEFSFRHRVMEFLATPAVASILLLIGVLGLYVEFTNPGAILPGVVGALCLLLFAITAQVLPVSAIGILLIVLAIFMFVLEIKVTSFGLLTLGGAVSLVVGAILLIDGPIPELRVPLPVILPTALLIAALCALAMRLALRAHTAKVTTGVEGLVGECGTVTKDLDPEGKVQVHGEIWDAATSEPAVGRGTRVRVVAVENMRLIVEAVDARSPTR